MNCNSFATPNTTITLPKNAYMNIPLLVKGEQANFVTSAVCNQCKITTIIAVVTSNYSSEKHNRDHTVPSTTATSNISPLKDSQVTPTGTEQYSPQSFSKFTDLKTSDDGEVT